MGGAKPRCAGAGRYLGCRCTCARTRPGSCCLWVWRECTSWWC